MGEELPLARQEEEGWSVLLASASAGDAIPADDNRNKGEETATTAKGCEGEEAKDTKTESEDSSEAQRTNVRPTRPKRRGRDNKNRKQGGGDEGEDKYPRRSAQELGVVFPGSFCDEIKTVPHHWIEYEKIYGGTLLKCSKCFSYIWLPTGWAEANYLSTLMKVHGKNEGYCRFLNRRRPAKILMAKMQDLTRLAKDYEYKNDREFAKIVDKILSDKDYDKKEE